MAIDHSLNTEQPSTQAAATRKGVKPLKSRATSAIPPPLIGGDKILVLPIEKPKKTVLQVSVDWVTFTAPWLNFDTVVDLCLNLAGRMHGKPECDLRESLKGLKGCSKNYELCRLDSDTGELVQVALVGLMAENKTSRALIVVSIPGSSCSSFDMAALALLPVDFPEAKITRCDLALDDFDGEFSVRRAQRIYRDGRFLAKGKAHGGCMPTSGFIEAKKGLVSLGKTFYVGKRENGKMLRVYEKGIKEDDDRKKWVRWEVQFGNKDRVLPWSMLFDTSPFFIGSYAPFLKLFGKRVVSADVAYIKTEQNKRAEATLAHLLKHCRVQYGKAIKIAMSKADARGQGPHVVYDRISRSGVPGRLVMPDSLALDSLFGPIELCPF